jgi:hypothetical protein
MISTEPLEFSATPFKKPHVVMAIINETPNGNSLVLSRSERVSVPPGVYSSAHEMSISASWARSDQHPSKIAKFSDPISQSFRCRVFHVHFPVSGGKKTSSVFGLIEHDEFVEYRMPYWAIELLRYSVQSTACLLAQFLNR